MRHHAQRSLMTECAQLTLDRNLHSAFFPRSFVTFIFFMPANLCARPLRTQFFFQDESVEAVCVVLRNRASQEVLMPFVKGECAYIVHCSLKSYFVAPCLAQAIFGVAQ